MEHMEQEERAALGTLLRQHRERRGLTREALAERVATGLSVETLSKVERGRVRPRRHTLQEVIAALGLDEAERQSVLSAWRAVPAPAAPAPSRRGTNDGARQSASPLQAQPASLLGRESDLEAIGRLLRRDGVPAGTRLLTLTGPGGVGKTQLALELGARLTGDFAAGSVFIDLSPVRDPAAVPAVLAQRVGMQDVRSAYILPRLYVYLGERQQLLILDNFEQVLTAAAWLADLLANCPGITLLVTSRAALHLRWEQTYQVPPLALPDPRHLPPLPELARVPAVALFLQRAQALTPDLVLTADNAPAVAELCVRLDGLPLAIELAAARTPVLSPRMILERLEQRLTLLRWEAPDLPERQRTLRAAIDWSYDLLATEEQALFRRLGVFVGGFDLDAAEAVAAAGGEHGLAERGRGLEALDVLAALVDKSLVAVEDRRTERVRYRLLESMREYALEQLTHAGEAEAARRAHARYALALAERAAPELLGPQQRAWFWRLEQEHDNLCAARAWLAAQGEDDLALRLAAALGYFWWARGYIEEGRRALEETLARAPQAAPFVRVAARAALGILLLWQGEHERARSMLRAALTAARTLGDPRSICLALIYLGVVANLSADWAAAADVLEEAVAQARQAGDAWATARSLHERGTTALGEGAYAAAEHVLDEAVTSYRTVGDDHNLAEALFWLGFATREQGDTSRAAVCIGQGLAIARELEDRRLLHHAADAVVWLVGDGGQPAQVGRLLGAAEALRQITGFAYEAWTRTPFAPAVAARRARLDPEGVAAHAEGHALSLEQMADVTRQALEGLTEATVGATEPVGAAGGRGVLSPREREVLGLVAEGRTNGEIAGALFITERTVRYHLTSIFTKLGADNRTQAVTLARERGLM